MTCRQTLCLPADPAGFERAAVILHAGGLVAFPTETVYGLGANALDAQAVRGIFAAKGRPADDPVIVHVASAALIERVCVPNESAWRLAERFWPGPLTLVLPKREVVPSEVTAGLPTVGVRVPSHLVAMALLEQADLPVAAPSANLFGRPSPTLAQHVLDDLAGRIDLVLDGGPANVGVESTIVDLAFDPPRLLRPGGLPAEQIEAVLGQRLQLATRHAGPQEAPGMLDVHYAPRTPLTLVTGPRARQRLLAEVQERVSGGSRVGVIALEEDVPLLPEGVHVQPVGTWSRPELSAARLFDALRQLDRLGLDVLFARELADPTRGLGRALADRLRRASQHIVD